MRLLCIGMVAALLAGCAGQTEMRKVAGDTASIMNDYRSELNAFAERQTAANADSKLRATSLNASRSMSEAYVNQRLLALKVAGDNAALESFGLIAAASAEQVVATSPLLGESAPAANAAVVKFDGSAVQKLTRQLNALRKPPGYWERVRQVVAQSEGLRGALTASHEQALAAADSADASSEEVAGALAIATPPRENQ